MNCSSSGAHLFSLERECSLESTDQLKKKSELIKGNTSSKIKSDRTKTERFIQRGDKKG